MAAGSTVWVALRSDGRRFDGSSTVLMVSHTWQEAFNRIMKEVIDELVDDLEGFKTLASVIGLWSDELQRPDVPQTRTELEALLQDPRAVLSGQPETYSHRGHVVAFEPEGVVKFYNFEDDLFTLVPSTLQPETDDVSPSSLPEPPARKRRNKLISRC